MKSQSDLFRELPSVDELLRLPELALLVEEDGQPAVADACRNVLNRVRAEIAGGHVSESRLELALSGIVPAVRAEVNRIVNYSLLPVINATGVILHTNLGRAPLAASAFEHIRETALTYSNLEFDVESGERGKRDVHVDRLFRKLLSRDDVAPHSAGRARTPVFSPALLRRRASSPVLLSEARHRLVKVICGTGGPREHRAYPALPIQHQTQDLSK